MAKRRASAKGGRTGELNALQRKLWRINLALALAVFVTLAVWWIGIETRVFSQPSAREEWLMEQADLTAILVFGIDVYAGFRKAKDKGMFLRNNWLEILVLLPLGTMFRVLRSFEQLELIGVMKKSAGVMELPIVIPDVITHAKRAGRGVLEVHKMVSHGKVFTEFSEALTRLLRGFPK